MRSEVNWRNRSLVNILDVLEDVWNGEIFGQQKKNKKKYENGLWCTCSTYIFFSHKHHSSILVYVVIHHQTCSSYQLKVGGRNYFDRQLSPPLLICAHPLCNQSFFNWVTFHQQMKHKIHRHRSIHGWNLYIYPSHGTISGWLICLPLLLAILSPTSAFISCFFSPCSCINQDGLSIRTGLTASIRLPSTASVAVQPHFNPIL